MSSTRYRGKWFWTITAANTAVCVLLIGLLYLMLSALAAFAAGVEARPVFVLFGVGVLLTAISWPLTRAVPTRPKRWVGYGLNGGAFLVYLMLFVAAAGIWIHVTRRLFLVPAGFQGTLYLVHDSNQRQGERKSFRRTRYLFPSDGVLETPDPAPTSFSDEYRYIYPDGHTQKLSDAGPGTLQDTPENRADMTEVVTYFGR
jgi:hypothetical protein